MKGWIALHDAAGLLMYFRSTAICAVTVRPDGGSYVYGAKMSDDSSFVVTEDQAAVLQAIKDAEADTEPF